MWEVLCPPSFRTPCPLCVPCGITSGMTCGWDAVVPVYTAVQLAGGTLASW